MTATLTAIAFLLFTALLVRAHVQRTGSAAAGVSGAHPTRICPRCKTPLAHAAARCPACGVPWQVFEMVLAREVVDDPSADSDARVHAIVRADVCIGCGACASACPEDGAIRMVGKLAVVDRAKCVGHGNCARACPVGGIALSTGAAVQRVEVPVVDRCFQSNVAGVYIVGELGGRGLIKNAINEARVAVDAIATELAGNASRCQDPDLLDVVVVGAGPAGLSAGLTALGHRLRYAVLERGTVADTIRKYPRHKLLLAEPVSIPVYGDLWVTDASKETLLEVWQTIIASTGLQVRTNCEVHNVHRENGELVVTSSAGALRARRVVLAVGRRGTPRRLEVPGEDRSNVYYDITEASEFEGTRVLVVGAGDSAIESAVGLANRPGTSVCLANRGATFEKAKARNREQLDKAVAQHKLRLLLHSQVREIRDGEVLLWHDGESLTIPNDHVIVRIGGETPVDFLDRVGVIRVKKDLAIATSECRGG